MAVKIRHLYKSYGSQKVLEDIGMHINDGETACIMGSPAGERRRCCVF